MSRTNMDVWKVSKNYYDCPEHIGPSGFENFDTCNICHYFWSRWQEDWDATVKKTNGIVSCCCEICEF